MIYIIKNLEAAKFKFEQDIVFNPKSELSYYPFKIFNKQEKNFGRTKFKNSNVVTLKMKKHLLPYEIKVVKSDYEKSKELNEIKSICKNFCDQSDELEIEIENLSKK